MFPLNDLSVAVPQESPRTLCKSHEALGSTESALSSNALCTSSLNVPGSVSAPSPPAPCPVVCRHTRSPPCDLSRSSRSASHAQIRSPPPALDQWSPARGPWPPCICRQQAGHVAVALLLQNPIRKQRGTWHASPNVHFLGKRLPRLPPGFIPRGRSVFRRQQEGELGLHEASRRYGPPCEPGGESDMGTRHPLHPGAETWSKEADAGRGPGNAPVLILPVALLRALSKSLNLCVPRFLPR